MEKDAKMKESSSKDISEREELLEKEVSLYRQTELLRDTATASYYLISAIRENTEVLKGIGLALNNIGEILDEKSGKSEPKSEEESDEDEDSDEEDEDEDEEEDEEEEELPPPKMKHKDLKPLKRRPLI